MRRGREFGWLATLDLALRPGPAPAGRVGDTADLAAGGTGHHVLSLVAAGRARGFGEPLDDQPGVAPGRRRRR